MQISFHAGGSIKQDLSLLMGGGSVPYLMERIPVLFVRNLSISVYYFYLSRRKLKSNRPLSHGCLGKT